MPTGPARSYGPLASGGCGQNGLSPGGSAARLEIHPLQVESKSTWGCARAPEAADPVEGVKGGRPERVPLSPGCPTTKARPLGRKPLLSRMAEQRREGVNREGKSNYNWFLPSHLLETKTWMEGSLTTTRPKSLSTANVGREGPAEPPLP